MSGSFHLLLLALGIGQRLIVDLFVEDFLDIADLFFDDAIDSLSGTLVFKLWVIGDLAYLLFHRSLDFVDLAFDLIVRSGCGGCCGCHISSP
jgi:hypothetical protein